jgi:hypothetical protein
MSFSAQGQLGSIPARGTGSTAAAFHLVYATTAADLRHACAQAMRRHPGLPCVGATSFQGIFAQGGFSPAPHALVGEVPDGLSMQAVLREVQGADALEQSIEACRELLALLPHRPTLLLLHATPGLEERVLAGIQQVLGTEVPVCGGTAGAPSLEQGFLVCLGNAHTAHGFVLAGFCADRPILHGFSSGFLPTEHRGTITRAVGRTVFEIDGHPAADVYNTWTGGRIGNALRDGGDVLMSTNLLPLARTVAGGSGIPRRLLAHPRSVLAGEGALTFFAELGRGERVELMTSTLDPMIERVSRMVQRLRPSGSVRGALLIFCAGTLSILQERAAEVSAAFSRATGNLPSVGIATFGEQGCFFERGRSYHGNLMCGCILF